MPSDEDSKTPGSSEKGKGESQGLATKAVATVFATVVAPVLIALGMKFSDVIVANFQPKPAPEATKAEPEKTTPAKAEPAKSESTAAEPAKTEVARVDPATTPAAEKKPDSSAAATDGQFAEHKGQFAERGKKRKKNQATGQPASVPEETSAGFTSLFSGRNLSGWTPNDGRVWSADAKNNVLVGSPADGKKQGHWLYSEKDFSDFRLRLEFRIEPNTDSGIALRTPPVFNVKEGRMVIQLTSIEKDPNPTGTFVTLMGGASTPQSRPKVAAPLRPAKEWNAVEIEFRGLHLSVKINGQTIQDLQVDKASGSGKPVAGLLQKTGRLGFECRTGHVEFRKIDIQELDAAGGK